MDSRAKRRREEEEEEELEEQPKSQTEEALDDAVPLEAEPAPEAESKIDDESKDDGTKAVTAPPVSVVWKRRRRRPRRRAQLNCSRLVLPPQVLGSPCPLQ